MVGLLGLVLFFFSSADKRENKTNTLVYEIGMSIGRTRLISIQPHQTIRLRPIRARNFLPKPQTFIFWAH